jgi:hypothetical protein
MEFLTANFISYCVVIYKEIVTKTFPQFYIKTSLPYVALFNVFFLSISQNSCIHQEPINVEVSDKPDISEASLEQTAQQPNKELSRRCQSETQLKKKGMPLTCQSQKSRTVSEGGIEGQKVKHLLSPPDPPSPTFSVQSNDSANSIAGWSKLRTTVKMASAVNRTRKKRKGSGMSRQDSFMKRFTTRYQGNSQNNGDSDDESAAGMLLSKARVTKAKEGKKPAVVNPDGNFMFYWLAFVTVAVLYNLWTCIAREGFPEIVAGYEIVWFVMDGICDLIYLIDICVQLRTGYLERGLVVYSTSKLAKHYVKSRAFYIDMFSLLPLDIVQFFIGLHPLIRFPRFLKAYRAYRFSYMVETRTVYPNMWRVANLSHILFLGSHWFAAFYYMISKAENFE